VIKADLDRLQNNLRVWREEITKIKTCLDSLKTVIVLCKDLTELIPVDMIKFDEPPMKRSRKSI
jgi:hypothetical protein